MEDSVPFLFNSTLLYFKIYFYSCIVREYTCILCLFIKICVFQLGLLNIILIVFYVDSRNVNRVLVSYDNVGLEISQLFSFIFLAGCIVKPYVLCNFFLVFLVLFIDTNSHFARFLYIN